MVYVCHRLYVELVLLYLTDFLQCHAVLLRERLGVEVHLHGLPVLYLVHEVLEEDYLLVDAVAAVVANDILVVLVHVVGDDAHRFLVVDYRRVGIDNLGVEEEL